MSENLSDFEGIKGRSLVEFDQFIGGRWRCMRSSFESVPVIISTRVLWLWFQF